MKSTLALLLAVSIVSGCALQPPDGQASLSERRTALIQGTAPGIDLLALRRAAAAAPPASAAAQAQPGAVAPAPAAAGRQASAPTPPVPAAASALAAPPSGRPLSEAKRLESAAFGVALPSARPAATPAPQPGGTQPAH